MPAGPQHFPARNRIVVALARALVVVEGAAKSGSRISVDHALDLGRDVFAVPGPVTSPLAETPLEMIREGATMIRGADDLLDDLGIDLVAARRRPPTSTRRRSGWNALVSPVPAGRRRSPGGHVLSDTLTALLGLELRGLVRARAGGSSAALRPSKAW